MAIRLTSEMALDAAALAYSELPIDLPASLSGASLAEQDRFHLADGVVGFGTAGRFSDSVTGLDMMVLRNDAGQVIVTFRGTDVGSPDDWLTNLGLGWPQWQAAREPLLAYLSSQRDSITEIHFTGHSLGGTLAQYAMFEYLQDASRFGLAPPTVGLTTFNALSGHDGLFKNIEETRTAAGTWTPESFAGAQASVAHFGAGIRHYYVDNDLVPRLGGGHIGGDTYVLRESALDQEPVLLAPMAPFTAHGIDTVQAILDSFPGLASREQASIDYLSQESLRIIAESIATFGNGQAVGADADPAETFLRLTAGLIGAVSLAVNVPSTGQPTIPDPGGEFEQLLRAYFLHSARATSATAFSREKYLALASVPWSTVLSLAFRNPVVGGVAAKTSAALVLTATVTDALGLNITDVFDFMAKKFPDATTEVIDNAQRAFGNLGVVGYVTVEPVLQIANVVLGDYFAGSEALLRVNQVSAGTDVVAEGGAGAVTLAFERAIDRGQVTLGLEVSDPSRVELVVGDIVGPEGLIGAVAARDGAPGEYTLTVVQGVSQLQLDYVTLVDDDRSASLVTINVVGAPFADFGPKLGAIVSGVAQIRITDIFDEAGFTHIVGTESDDPVGVLSGGVTNDVIEGLGGDDHIVGGGGEDRLDGGVGDDFIVGGEGNDLIVGGAGRDVAVGAGGVDDIRGGVDADFLSGGEQDDYLDAGDGDDVIAGGGGSDVLLGDLGDDILYGDGTFEAQQRDWSAGSAVAADGTVTITLTHVEGSETTAVTDGDDRIHAGAGNDIVFGGGGADTLFGAAGDDFLQGDGGDDVMDGGDGADRLHGDSRIDHTVTGNDTLAGGAGNDELVGGDGQDTLFGGAGDDLLIGDDILAPEVGAADRLYGDAGDDQLQGGVGSDLLYGGAGNDTLIGDYDSPLGGTQGADLLDGGAGDDLLRGGGGDDELFGGEGNDELQGDSSGSGLASHGNDTLRGGPGEDRLFGQGGNDLLLGGPGPDRIAGGEGDDTLYGDEDDDLLFGEAGEDVLYGGAGADELQGGGDADRLRGEAGDDRLFGDAGDDDLDAGSGDDELQGGAGDDRLAGGSGADLLFGQAGADTLLGGGGADRLEGGDGSDLLQAGDGDDVLLGGAGDDSLDGGAGDDIHQAGPGTDFSSDGGGDDRYLFDAGWGNDLIDDAGGVDTLEFGAGVGSSEIDVVRSDRDLLLVRRGSNDRIEIPHWFDRPDGQIENVLFADGTTWDVAALEARTLESLGSDAADILRGHDDAADVLEGGAGNDTLLGFGGEDTLEGGAGDDFLDGGSGDDLLVGGPGNDIYRIAADGGMDIVVDDASGASVNQIRLAPGIVPGDIVAGRVGDDLVLDIGAAGQGATLRGYFLDPAAFQLRLASGRSLNVDDLFAPPPTGDEAILGNAREVFRESRFAGLVADAQRADSTHQGIHAGIVVLVSEDNGAAFGPRWVGDEYIYPDLPGSFAGVNWFWQTTAPPPRVATDTAVLTFAGTDGSEVVVNVPEVATTSRTRAATLILDGFGSTSSTSTRTVVGYEYQDEPSGSRFPSTGSGLSANVPTRFETYRMYEAELGGGDDTFDGTPDGGIAGARAIVDGGAGNDTLQGSIRDDFLFGGAGDDLISGERGDDVLAGGDGSDRLLGWTGADSYYVGFDDTGVDIIEDDGFFTSETTRQQYPEQGLPQGLVGAPQGLPRTLAARERLEFVEAYLRHAPETDITTLLGGGGQPSAPGSFAPGYVVDTLYLNVPLSLVALDWAEVNGRNAIDIRWGDGAERGVQVTTRRRGQDVLGYGIERFVFDDVTLSRDQLLATMAAEPSREIVIDGTPGDDDIAGTPFAEIIRGFDGADIIRAGDGDDVIEAGPGDDIIDGGDGDDIIEGGPGDDFIDGRDGADRVSGGPGNDYFAVADFNDVYRLLRGDGHDELDIIDGGNITVLFGGETAAVAIDLAALSVAHDASGALVVDYGPGDRLSIPDWDFASQRLARVVSETLDAEGVPVELFSLTSEQLAALAGNGAPRVVAPVGNRTVNQHTGFSFPLAGTFTDPNAGDSLTLSAVLAGGGELPGWVSFDAASGILAGVAGAAVTGSITIELTATDAGGLFATNHFGLTVNTAPVLLTPLVDGAASQDTPFVYPITASQFADPDPGDRLTLSASLAGGGTLPAWLVFSAPPGDPYGSFGGTPANGDGGVFDIEVTATDAGGLAVSDIFTLTVESLDSGPAVAAPLADQTVTEDQPWSFTVSPATFADTGVAPGLSATLAGGGALPAWLSFDAFAGTFSGTPAGADVGGLDIEVRATYADGLYATDRFTVTVENANHAPVLLRPLADRSAVQDTPFFHVLTPLDFTDPDLGDSITLSASLSGGGALPAWLVFAAPLGGLFGSFRGTPGSGDGGVFDIEVTATDAGGLATSDVFTLTVESLNSAPTVAVPLADQTLAEGQPFSFTVPPVSFVDTDAGSPLELSATLAGGGALPAWLSFDASNGAFAGTPGNDDVGGFEVEVKATDSQGLYATDRFALTVEPANAAPVVVAPLPAFVTPEALAFTYTIASGTFADADADAVLTLSATLADGSQPPDWLSFDPSAGVFTGTPPDGSAGRLSLLLVAADQHDATVQTPFSLFVRDSVVGTDGADTLIGKKRRDVVVGGGGDDELYGENGADLLDGGAGDDLLSGGNGRDVLRGGAGNDTLQGGGGNDVYQFGRGDGIDRIDESHGRRDQVDFGIDIAAEQLWFSREGDDLAIDLVGSEDRLIVDDWYFSGNKQVETFTTVAGEALRATQLQLLVDAMAGFAPPAGLGTVLSTEVRETIAPVMAAAWQAPSG